MKRNLAAALTSSSPWSVSDVEFLTGRQLAGSWASRGRWVARLVREGNLPGAAAAQPSTAVQARHARAVYPVTNTPETRRWVVEHPSEGFHGDWKASPIGSARSGCFPTRRAPTLGHEHADSVPLWTAPVGQPVGSAAEHGDQGVSAVRQADQQGNPSKHQQGSHGTSMTPCGPALTELVAGSGEFSRGSDGNSGSG